MSLLTDAQALQIREALIPLADLKKISEVGTLSVTTAGGVAIAGLSNLPVTLKTDMERSPDTDQQVEAIVLVRRDELPTVIPAIDRTMRAVVMFAGRTITYQVLRVAPNKLATVYRMELRRVQGATYG